MGDDSDDVLLSRPHPRLRVVVAAIAVLALVGVAASGLLAVRRRSSTPAGARIALQGTGEGSIELVLGDDGNAYMVTTDVPRPDANRVYEGSWIVDGRPVPAGAFRAGPGRMVGRLGPIDRRADRFTVTIEDAQRGTQSGPVVASADLFF